CRFPSVWRGRRSWLGGSGSARNQSSPLALHSYRSLRNKAEAWSRHLVRRRSEGPAESAARSLPVLAQQKRQKTLILLQPVQTRGQHPILLAEFRNRLARADPGRREGLARRALQVGVNLGRRRRSTVAVENGSVGRGRFGE